MNRFIPQNRYHFDADGILWTNDSGKPVQLCNFCPIVDAVLETQNESGEPLRILHCRSAQKQGVLEEVVEVILPREENIAKLFQRASPQLVCYTKPRLLNLAFADILAFQSQSLESRKVPYFSKLGWKIEAGLPCYCTGGYIIKADGLIDSLQNRAFVEPALRGFALQVDATTSEEAAALYMQELVKAVPGVTDLLVANLISGLLHSRLQEMGLPADFLLYLVGPSQSKKTTIAKLTSLPYQRGSSQPEGLFSLNSTATVLQSHAVTLRDSVVVFDDLFAGEHKDAKRAREKTVDTLIREVANRTPRETFWNRDIPPIECGCVITCEYGLQTVSTMGRSVVVRVEPIDGKVISKFQSHPLALSTFILYFLQWVCRQYCEIKSVLTTSFQKFQQRNGCCGQETRLNEATFLLEQCFLLFCAYLKNLELSYEDIWAKFNDSVKRVKEQYRSRMQTLERRKRPAANILGNSYADGLMHLTDKPEKIYHEKFDGLIKHGRIIALKPGWVVNLVSQARGISCTQTQIAQELLDAGVLVVDQSGAKTKKVAGIRLLHLDLDALGNFVSEERECIFDLRFRKKCT